MLRLVTCALRAQSVELGQGRQVTGASLTTRSNVSRQVCCLGRLPTQNDGCACGCVRGSSPAPSPKTVTQCPHRWLCSIVAGLAALATQCQRT